MASTEVNNSNRPSNVKPGDRDIVGIAFPFQRGDGEFPKRLRNIDLVSNDFYALFQIPLRSLVMRPTVGSMVYKTVFESVGPLLKAMIQRDVVMSTLQQEPRVLLRGLTIEDQDKLVETTVYYTVQGVKQDISLEIQKSV